MLLIENAYINSELLEKIDSALSKNQNRLHQKLLNCLRHFDYPEARRILTNIISSVQGEVT
jgi:transcriptional regulator with PAS, ATPase and Fis domain